MSSPSRQTAIGIEPETQTVTVIFPAPVTYLRLSVEPAESFANSLLKQAKLLNSKFRSKFRTEEKKDRKDRKERNAIALSK